MPAPRYLLLIRRCQHPWGEKNPRIICTYWISNTAYFLSSPPIAITDPVSAPSYDAAPRDAKSTYFARDNLS